MKSRTCSLLVRLENTSDQRELPTDPRGTVKQNKKNTPTVVSNVA